MAAGHARTYPSTQPNTISHPSTPVSQTMDELVYRTAHAMAAEGMPFRGTLFAGLMIKDGKARP
jgi:phosphoribosylamine-glycine ligase